MKDSDRLDVVSILLMVAGAAFMFVAFTENPISKLIAAWTLVGAGFVTLFLGVKR